MAEQEATAAQKNVVPEETYQGTTTNAADSAAQDNNKKANTPNKETTSSKKGAGATAKGTTSKKGTGAANKVTIPPKQGTTTPKKEIATASKGTNVSKKETGTIVKGSHAAHNMMQEVKATFKMYPAFFSRKEACPFRSEDWLRAGHIPQAALRAKKDIACLYTHPVPGVFFVPDENNLMCVRAIIVGNFDTPYEGGFFHFYIRFGPQYPFEPPRVCSMSCYRFGNKVRFNPNMYEDGTVCLSILGTWSGPAWTAANTLSVVLLSIQSLFCDQALCNEPGYSVFRDTGNKSVEFYDVYVRHETLRVAVIHTIQCAEEYKIPPELISVMKSSFMEYYDSYIASCETYRKYDGKKLEVILIGSRNFFPNFTKLEEDLVKLHAKLTEEEASTGKFSFDKKFITENASASCSSADSSLSEFSDIDAPTAAPSQNTSNIKTTSTHSLAPSSSASSKEDQSLVASRSSSSEDSVGEPSKSKPRKKSKLKSLKSSGLASMVQCLVSNIKKVGSGSPTPDKKKKVEKVNRKVATAIKIDSAYCEQILKEVSGLDGDNVSHSDSNIEDCLDFMSFMAESESEYEELSNSDQFSQSEEDDDGDALDEVKNTEQSGDESSSSPADRDTAAAGIGSSSFEEPNSCSSSELTTKSSEIAMDLPPSEVSKHSKDTEVCNDDSFDSDSSGRGCKRENSGVIKTGHGEDERGNCSSPQ